MDRKQEKITRPPVVVVVGHIDHGKSSLLEAIREDFRITSRESGGITQHIGAYQAEYDKKKITFLDTPGHEAFSAMRNRGTMVADIAVLVVDAAEGVHPQTKEAAKFIKQAGIPVVVALNKIDKPQAQPEKVKKELAQIDLIVESLGGKIIAGYVERNSLAEVIREDELIGKGSIKTLQQEKRDIQQAGKGKEIGILFKGDIEIKEGDILQVYKEEKFKSGY